MVRRFGDQYIAWRFWYGGGKHGEPEAVEDWLETAFFVVVTEEQQIIKRVYAKAEDDE